MCRLILDIEWKKLPTFLCYLLLEMFKIKRNSDSDLLAADLYLCFILLGFTLKKRIIQKSYI